MDSTLNVVTLYKYNNKFSKVLVSNVSMSRLQLWCSITFQVPLEVKCYSHCDTIVSSMETSLRSIVGVIIKYILPIVLSPLFWKNTWRCVGLVQSTNCTSYYYYSRDIEFHVIVPLQLLLFFEHILNALYFSSRFFGPHFPSLWVSN